MIEYKKVSRIILLSFILILLIYLLIKVWSILIPFFLGAFFAYLLAPIVNKLQNKGFSRSSAILLVYTIVFGSLLILGIIGFPILVSQLTNIINSLPEYANKLGGFVDRMQEKYSHYGLPPGIKALIDERIIKTEKTLLNFIRQLLNYLMNSFSYIITMIITPVVAFYLLKDSKELKNDLENLIPKNIRSDVFALFRDMDDIISAYIRGHLLVSLLIGILTGTAMYLIGLKYALLIGIIAAITEIIPYFGPIIGAIPAIVIALFQSIQLTTKVVLAVFIIQQIETHIISPKIMGDSIGLHPLTIMFIILAGGHLFGILGMLLAVPITAILKVIIRYIYLKVVS